MGNSDGVGDPDEHPPHKVALAAYCIDKTEVTVKDYQAFVSAKDSSKRTVYWTGISEGDVNRFSQLCNDEKRPDHPINCVSWDQAVAYCSAVGKQLPTEAEWEYAARGSDKRTYPWPTGAPNERRMNGCGAECVALAGRVVNLRAERMYNARDGWDTTAPVGSFLDGASPFGALDMAGNVWEWTADWYEPYPRGGVLEAGAEPYTRRVYRGGSWLNGDGRVAHRAAAGPAYRSSTVGFRCMQRD